MTSPRSPIRVLIACAALLLGAIVIGSSYLIGHFRDGELRDTERELKNTALILAEQLDRSFQSVGLVQHSVLDAIAAAHVETAEQFASVMGARDMHRMLADKVSGLAHVEAVTIVDAQGELLISSRRWPTPTINVADRDYFIALKGDPSLSSFVSRPLHNRADGKESFYLARKIQNSRGDFLGLVLGAVELGYFEKMFGAILLGDGGSVSLYRADGMLLVRNPRLEAPIGHIFTEGLNALGTGVDGTAHFIGTMDGKERILAVHRLGHFPLYVSVGRDIDFALARWRDQTKVLLGAGLAVALVIALTLLLVGAYLRRSHQWSARMLAREKEWLDCAIDGLPQGLVLFGPDERLVVCNRRYGEMYGHYDGVLPGTHYRDIVAAWTRLIGLHHDPVAYCAERRRRMSEGKPFETLTDLPDGRTIRIISHPAANGGWLSVHEDVTARLQLERERDRDREFLDRIVENVPTPIMVKDVQTWRYILVNKAGLDYLGVAREQALGKTCDQVWPAYEAARIQAADINALASGHLFTDEHVLHSPGRGERNVTSQRLVVRDREGEPNFLLTVIEDVTERKESERRIAHLAHHDALTGLPNRVLFRERLDKSLRRLRAEGRLLALLYLDLDHFKAINDSLGHPIGDELLKQVSGRLGACVGAGGLVARLGGDEFAIVQTEAVATDDVTALARRILDGIAGSYDVFGHRLAVDASIGIALAPQNGGDADELLKNADLAMYAAKADGRGKYRLFEPAMDARMKARRTLEFDLREAIMVGGFELHYQPLVVLDSGRIAGCEALLRWPHRTRGSIAPADFIPVAEESGLIVPLGDWVLRTACAEAARWPDGLKVAVNVSPVQFSEALVETVVGALAASGLPAHRLELEVTEAVLIRDDQVAIKVLHRLRSLGVRIALDDFGTGYSSLSYLQRFPFDKIKIDRSFIRGVETSASSRNIVQAIVDIATTQQVATTAEGVETEAQRNAVRSLGCTEMQGYLFSRPVPADELATLLEAPPMRLARAG